ncbi:MAG TPA: hypothetical protein P5186_28160, partial [Candidatus Paceibacterota bacterium]|nr:hypothetical protein [Candidatus Paceibacterota bacterium]HSA03373.1 hypothetical protein [Candidatus Paceibacterota bacterium]
CQRDNGKGRVLLGRDYPWEFRLVLGVFQMEVDVVGCLLFALRACAHLGYPTGIILRRPGAIARPFCCCCWGRT